MSLRKLPLLLILLALASACSFPQRFSQFFQDGNVEAPPIAVVPFDDDNDGIPKPRDLCPSSTEEELGAIGKDGCPDGDEDGDGVVDSFDKCPGTPKGESVFDYDGCMDHSYKGTFRVTCFEKDGSSWDRIEHTYHGDVSRATAEQELKETADSQREGIKLEHAATGLNCNVAEEGVESIPKEEAKDFCFGRNCDAPAPKTEDEVGDRLDLEFGNDKEDEAEPAEELGPAPQPAPVPGPQPTPIPAPGPNGGTPSPGPGPIFVPVPGAPTPQPGPEPETGPRPNPGPEVEVPTPDIPVVVRPGGGGGGADIPLEEIQRVLGNAGLSTDPASKNARGLYQVAESLNKLGTLQTPRLNGPDNRRLFTDFVQASDAAMRVADEKYVENREGEGNSFLYLATRMAEAAYDIATSDLAVEIYTAVGPGAVLRDLYEATTGKSLIDGRPLENWERAMAVAGVATGGIGSKIFKGIKTAGKIAGVSAAIGTIGKKLGTADDVAEAVAKDAATIGKIGEDWGLKADELGEVLGSHQGQTILSGKLIDTVEIEEGVHKALDKSVRVNNPFPENGIFARVVHKDDIESILNKTRPLAYPPRDDFQNEIVDELGKPVREAFVTAYDDIADVKNDPVALAKRLSLFKDAAGTELRDMSNHVVLTFKFEAQPVLSTPYETVGNLRKYGFLNGGRTQGQAREWLVHSEAIEKGIIIPIGYEKVLK